MRDFVRWGALFLCMLFCLFGLAQDAKKGSKKQLEPAFGPEFGFYSNTTQIYRYRDVELSIKATYPLFRNFQAGFRVAFMHGWSNRLSEGRNFFMAGPLFEYRFFRAGRFGLFGQAGVLTGNYCDCGDFEPYRANNLWYISLGPRGSFALNDHFYVTATLLLQPILGSVVDPNWANRGLVGVEYRF